MEIRVLYQACDADSLGDADDNIASAYNDIIAERIYASIASVPEAQGASVWVRGADGWVSDDSPVVSVVNGSSSLEVKIAAAIGDMEGAHEGVLDEAIQRCEEDE